MMVTSVLYLWRNNHVAKIRQRAIVLTGEISKVRIARGERGREVISPWDEFYRYGSYDKMFWDLRKWKFEQFYPGLQARRDVYLASNTNRGVIA